ncbi:MAG: hypothetical protein AAB400_03620 [Patescibacteria group bacterium]
MFFEFTLIHPSPVWAASEAAPTPLQAFGGFWQEDGVTSDDENTESIEESPSLTATIIKIKEVKKKPVIAVKKKREIAVVATAYSSSVEETDSDPCTTANGFNVCKNNIENVIAANFLPFGTRVRMPELFGERTFTVHDRMNSRYGRGRIDIWLKTKKSARQFGVKRIKMEIVEDQVAANL